MAGLRPAIEAHDELGAAASRQIVNDGALAFIAETETNDEGRFRHDLRRSPSREGLAEPQEEASPPRERLDDGVRFVFAPARLAVRVLATIGFFLLLWRERPPPAFHR